MTIFLSDFSVEKVTTNNPVFAKKTKYSDELYLKQIHQMYYKQNIQIYKVCKECIN